jgi:hypothetical protein
MEAAVASLQGLQTNTTKIAVAYMKDCGKLQQNMEGSSCGLFRIVENYKNSSNYSVSP